MALRGRNKAAQIRAIKAKGARQTNFVRSIRSRQNNKVYLARVKDVKDDGEVRQIHLEGLGRATKSKLKKFDVAPLPAKWKKRL